MKSVLINQNVEVRWRIPQADKSKTPSDLDEVTRTFPNLIPACEFAVSMAREGDQQIELHPESGPILSLSEAQTIAKNWESGEIAETAESLDV